MEVRLPYTSIDASGRWIQVWVRGISFPALLLQQGGRVYNDSLSATELSDPIAQQAFIDWAEFYQLYDMPLTYDFYNRFRTGEMPIGITSYTMYNQLTVAAPEIRGCGKCSPSRAPRARTERWIFLRAAPEPRRLSCGIPRIPRRAGSFKVVGPPRRLKPVTAVISKPPWAFRPAIPPLISRRFRISLDPAGNREPDEAVGKRGRDS